MKRLSKSVIAIWFFAIMFFVSSFSFISSGEIGSFFFGVALSALLAFWGYKRYKNPPQRKEKVSKARVNDGPDIREVPIKVAGVTFSDGGVSRQDVLKSLKEEYRDYGVPSLRLEHYLWKGEDAYAIYADDQIIGNIPADTVPYIKKNYDRIHSVSDIKIYGGGRNDYGERKNYGAEITLSLLPPK